MNTYTLYNTDGRICGTLYCPEEDLELYYPEVTRYVVGDVNAATHYVSDAGVVTQRPTQGTTLSNTEVVADGVAAEVLKNLPVPCIVTIEDTHHYEVTDGELEFTLDSTGTYTLRVSQCFPFLDKEFTCEGIAPL